MILLSTLKNTVKNEALATDTNLDFANVTKIIPLLKRQKHKSLTMQKLGYKGLKERKSE